MSSINLNHSGVTVTTQNNGTLNFSDNALGSQIFDATDSVWFTESNASIASAEWFAANLGDVVDGNLDAGDAFIDLAANDNAVVVACGEVA